jgi:hypothetical protein
MDDREKSIDALKTVIRIMDTEKDHVVVITIKSGTMNSNAIEEKSVQILEEAGVKNHTFYLHEKEYSERVEDAIVDYINVDDTRYIDFVAVANRGIAHSHISEKDKHLGKVAKGVLFRSLANVLLVA